MKQAFSASPSTKGTRESIAEVNRRYKEYTEVHSHTHTHTIMYTLFDTNTHMPITFARGHKYLPPVLTRPHVRQLDESFAGTVTIPRLMRVVLPVSSSSLLSSLEHEHLRGGAGELARGVPHQNER